MSSGFTSRPWDSGRWHYRRSLASRVTVLTTMAVAMAVAFVALGAYMTVRVQTQASMDEALLERAYDAAAAPTLPALISDGIPMSEIGIGDVRIVYIAPNGRVVQVDGGQPLPLGAPEAAVATGSSVKALRTMISAHRRYRAVTVPIPGEGGALTLAQPLAPTDRVLERLGLVMLLFGAAGVIAAGLAGWAVARNGLRPVRRLTAEVEEIALTERLSPISIEGDDEMARLASAFNFLLASVAGSRDRQRQLVADAGHELRTPLTSLRTNLDLLSQADRAGGLPPKARAELLDDVSAQIGELTTLINDLVELAREDPTAAVVESVDLRDVVERAVARVRLRAPTVEFRTQLQHWMVQGEALALERAVTNLLDNAAKWSPPGEPVSVRLIDGVLSVADRGPGISEDDLPHVFDRFYRSAESRAMPGSGLGLSIVRQVAERHGGTARAATGPDGGALLTLHLPGQPG